MVSRQRSHVVLAIVASAAAVAAQNGWQQQFPLQSPPARGYHAMVFDIVNNQSVLFGGWDFSTFHGDTWLWNGTAWTQVATPLAPSPRLGHAMAFDVGRNRVVLFGGAVGGGAGTDSDETWEWSGGQWTQLQPAVRPSPRRAVVMTYDAARSVCLLFGGGFGATATTVHDDTWQWDGTAWTLRNPVNHPSPRWANSLVYDWSRHDVVLHGGSAGAVQQSLDDTWTWDGTNWTQRSPTTVPTARRGAGAAFDIQRDVTVVSGGLGSGATFLDDTWLWDGSDWRRDTRLPTPGTKMTFALAYDLLRGRCVTFGGYSGGLSQETWEYEPGQLASWQPFGAGCAGANGTPTVGRSPGSWPVAGATFTMRLAYGSGNNAAVLVVGTSSTQWLGGSLPQSLAPLGMPGCSLLVSTDWLSALPLAGGTATVAWQLPATAATIGFPFFAQGLVVEPGVNPFGAIVSAGAAGIVGAL